MNYKDSRRQRLWFGCFPEPFSVDLNVTTLTGTPTIQSRLVHWAGLTTEAYEQRKQKTSMWPYGRPADGLVEGFMSQL